MYWKLSYAVMHLGQNISKLEVIESLAEELLNENPELFDLKLFKIDLLGKESRQEFKKDLEKVSFQKVERFPTLLLLNEVNRKRAMTVGYRSYQDLISVLTLITNGGNEIPK